MEIRKKKKGLVSYAYCRNCLWRCEAITPASAIGHAARHTRNTGHETGADISNRIMFVPEGEEFHDEKGTTPIGDNKNYRV